jgi:hypothetical protein
VSCMELLGWAPGLSLWHSKDQSRNSAHWESPLRLTACDFPFHPQESDQSALALEFGVLGVVFGTVTP